MPEIRVAIAGVGNCASFLVQSIFCSKVENEPLGGYRVSDIKFTAAFDVSREKVYKDLSEAIFSYPNITPKFADVGKLGVEVKPGPVLDGVAEHMEDAFRPMNHQCTVKDVARELEGSDILLSMLPVGSERATRFYAEAALRAGTAFVNAIPVFIASIKEWGERFEQARLPLVGDDIKGQLGATILHRALVRLFDIRKVKVVETYQLNVGGNTDFLNMVDERRLSSKRISKTRAVTSVLPYEMGVRIGPSDYVPFLGNTKVAYVHIRGEGCGGFPVTIDLKLIVDDKSMFAGSMLDVLRLTKVALDRGLGGPMKEISAFYFKYPPVQARSDEEALRWLECWLNDPRYQVA